MKKINGGIHTPGTLYSSFWFFFTFFPILILYNVPINPLPILYILITAISFNLPSLLFDWRIASNSLKKNNIYLLESFRSSFLVFTFFIAFICSFFFLFLMLLQNGFNLTLFLIDFIGSSTEFANTRTLYDYQYGIIGQLATFFPFLVATIGGFITFNSGKKSKKIMWFILSIIPVMLSMLFQSSKILFLYGILFYSGVYLFLKIYTGNKTLIDRKTLKYFCLTVIIFLPILIFSFKSRQGYNDLSVIDLIPTIFSYFFGSIYAFSDYFVFLIGGDSVSLYIDEKDLTYGYYSFKPLFEIFGGTKVFPIGYYEDDYNFMYYIRSNIFTYFRQLIQDFGIIGSIFFIFLMGFILHVFFYIMHRSKKPIFSISVFIVFIVFLGISYLINAFTARSVVLIGISLYILLNVNMCIQKKMLR